MNKFDFLSGAPKTLIFEMTSNKTNLGGVLTLIYLIIVLLIIMGYIYDFSKSQLYTTTYSYDYQFNDDIEFMNSRYENQSLNPKLNFTFDIFNDNLDFKVNKSNFGLIYYDTETRKVCDVGPKENFQTSIYDLKFFLYYKCKIDIDGNCTIRDEDKSESNLFFLNFNYLGFKLEHQNEESPIKREYRTNQYTFSLNDKISLPLLRWKTIIYKEEIGGIMGLFFNLQGENNNIYGGEFLDPISMTFSEEDLGAKPENGIKILSIIQINYNDPGNYYYKYSRKKKEYN